MHMAIGAVVNAAWDLASRRAGLPLWQYIASLTSRANWSIRSTSVTSPTRSVARRRLTILQRGRAGSQPTASSHLLECGYPGVHDLGGLARLRRRQGGAAGTRGGGRRVHADQAQGRRRPRRRRAPRAPRARNGRPRHRAGDRRQPALGRRRGDRLGRPTLAPYGLRWIEEPTSPDDVLGMATIARAVAPIAVATGEHVANRVMFKQLLQAEAISVLQLDACRVGGVNENLAILLLAAKFGVPVCPHAGGVGPVRTRPALGDGRLRRRQRRARRARDRVRRPPPRALRRPGDRRRRPLRGTDGARIRCPHAPRQRRPIPVPRRSGVGSRDRRTASDFEGLVAAVTGGSSGIGLATAHAARGTRRPRRTARHLPHRPTASPTHGRPGSRHTSPAMSPTTQSVRAAIADGRRASRRTRRRRRQRRHRRPGHGR